MSIESTTIDHSSLSDGLPDGAMARHLDRPDIVYEGKQRLGDFFKSSRKKGLPGIPLLSVTLHDGLVVRDSLERRRETSINPEDHLLVQEGFIAYNMMRAWQGALGRASSDGLVSPAYVVLKPTKDIDSKFAEYLFKTPRMIYLFWAYSYGLTRDRLRLYYNDFARIPIALPSLPEQKKIAQILFAWDKAINTTGQLLAKSQQYKKALMKQLLTGKKRFPGFSDEWKSLRLDKLVTIHYGKSPKEIISTNGVYPVFGTSGVTGMTDTPICSKRAVLIGRKGTIDKPFFINTPFWAIDTTFYCLANAGIDITWFFYSVSAIKLKKYSEASGVPSLLRDTLYSIQVMVPMSLEEQQKIASILSAADREIETLQQKLDYLKQEKKSLMQQLLTGKCRVTISHSFRGAGPDFNYNTKEAQRFVTRRKMKGSI